MSQHDSSWNRFIRKQKIIVLNCTIKILLFINILIYKRPKSYNIVNSKVICKTIVKLYNVLFSQLIDIHNVYCTTTE